MAGERTYTGGHFALDIMGVNAGFLKKFDGLQMEADIVSNDLGPANIQKKHVANIRWTPAKATIGIGMGKEMYTIIQRAFAAQQKPFDGALHVADFNYKIQSSLNFTGAIMTSVTVPKMDGSSKDAAYFDLEWEAETVRWLKGDHSDIRRPIAPEQKAWLCSNFRFEMGGLPCNRVATIDSFTWKCAVVRDPIGEPTTRPAKVTVPNIKVEVSMADYDAWFQAAKKWFIDGAPRGERRDVGRDRLPRPRHEDRDRSRDAQELWLREVHARRLRSEQREGRPLLVRVLRRAHGVRDQERGRADVS